MGRKRTHDAEMDEQMRSYKAQGNTAKEVAEKFCISCSLASRICKGVAPQPSGSGCDKSVRFMKAFNEERFGCLEERANNFLARFAPHMEYVSDYTGNKGHITVRCKACGDVKTRSCNAIRTAIIRSV